MSLNIDSFLENDDSKVMKDLTPDLVKILIIYPPGVAAFQVVLPKMTFDQLIGKTFVIRKKDGHLVDSGKIIKV